MRELNKHPFDTIVSEAVKLGAVSIVGDIGTGKTFIAEKIKLKLSRSHHIVTVDLHEDHNTNLGYEYIGVKTLTKILYGRTRYGGSNEPLVVIIDSLDYFIMNGYEDRYRTIRTIINQYEELNIIPIFVHDLNRHGKLFKSSSMVLDTVINLSWEDDVRTAVLSSDKFDGQIIVNTTEGMYKG